MVNKDQFRQWGYQQRQSQQNRQTVSQVICERVVKRPAYQQAETVMWYLGCRTEVETLVQVKAELQTNAKRIVIPFCTLDAHGDRMLGLWQLSDLDELTPGMWGILEPPEYRRNDRGKIVAEIDLDVIIVPGVVFDQSGGRVGNGAGYYDRLLASIRKEAFKIGVGFDSQVVEEVPAQAHDISMDEVVTEKQIYSQAVGNVG